MNPSGRFLFGWLAAALLGLVLVSCSKPDDGVRDSSSEVIRQEQALERLKAENDALREQNARQQQLLRDAQRMRGTAPGAISRQAVTQPSSGGYWLTTSSGIRHNSSCRY
ncbi:MAG: hypothetical protein AB9869_32835 [Verrucomicrobiia bacterium]